MSLAPNLKRGLRVGVYPGSLSYRERGREEGVGRRGKEFRSWELYSSTCWKVMLTPLLAQYTGSRDVEVTQL